MVVSKVVICRAKYRFCYHNPLFRGVGGVVVSNVVICRAKYRSCYHNLLFRGGQGGERIGNIYAVVVEPIFVIYHPLFYALTTPSLEGGRGVRELQKGCMGAVIASRFAVKP